MRLWPPKKNPLTTAVYAAVLLNPRNTKKIVGYLGNEVSANLIPHHINLSRVSTEDYQQMTSIIRGVLEDDYPQLGLDGCDIKEELNKVGLQYLSTSRFLHRTCCIYKLHIHLKHDSFNDFMSYES